MYGYISIILFTLIIISLVYGVQGYFKHQKVGYVNWPLLDTKSITVDMVKTTQNLNKNFDILSNYNVSEKQGLSEPYSLSFYHDNTSVDDGSSKPIVTIVRVGGNITLDLSDNLTEVYGHETKTSFGTTAYYRYAMYEYKKGDQIQFTNASATGTPISALVNTKNISNINISLYDILKNKNRGDKANFYRKNI